ncbi:MAG TPA: tetratricopeptide repeat protein, partial [Acidobacteriota bacterium]|nr:tetratricopeptide repeat protein [Acidobacteriota bacterium]
PRTTSTATPLKDNPAAKPAPPPVEKSARTSSDSPVTVKDKDRSNPKTAKPDLPSRPAQLGILTLTTNVVDSKFTLTNTGTKLPGPSGAFINLNQLTQDLNVLPGQYLVTIQHPDFEPFSQQVQIVAGGKVALNAVLQPHPVVPGNTGNSKDTAASTTSPPADSTSSESSRPYLSRRRTTTPAVEMGSLALTVTVDGATYTITSAATGKKILNGNFLKSGDLTQQLSLEPGVYMVEVRHPEYSVFHKKVQIQPRGQFLLTAELEPSAASSKKTKKTSQSVIDRGMNKLIQGDYDGAIKDMYQAREFNPALKSQLNVALAQAYFQRGLAKKDRQDFSGASEDVKASIALDPNRPVVHIELATLLANQGNLVGAIESGKRATELDPVNPEYQEALLLWYQQLGVKQKENNQFDLAEGSFLAATRLSPRYASVYNHLGECQAQLGKQQEAEVNLREAVRLDPGNARYLRNLGVHLVNQAKFAEAIPFLKDCIRIEQGDGKTYYFLGVAHARNGELQFAEEAL